MKRKFFQTVLALVPLFATLQSYAENIGFAIDTFPNCNLPATSELKITSIGTNWATLKWTAVPGATAYRVKASRLPGGFVDADVQTPATDITLNGLVAAGYYRFSVAAICPNGIPSDISKSELQTLIVLDIVLNARPPKNCDYVVTNEGCHHEPWQANSLNATCWVRVSQGSASSFFQVKTVGAFGVSTGQVNNWCSNPSEPAPPALGAVLTNDQGDLDPSTSLQFAQIVLSGTALCQLITWKTGDEVFVCVEEPVEGYAFAFLDEGTGFAPPVSDEYGAETQPIQTEGLELAAIENPFGNVLQCNVKVSEKTSFSLFLLGQQGQLVFQQHFEGVEGTQSIGIKTGHLLPGIYFLKIESPMGARVIKLAKAQ